MLWRLFAYTCAALALMVVIGNRLFGRPGGLYRGGRSGPCPGLTPIQTLEPAADGIELAWLLASFAAALFGLRQRLAKAGPLAVRHRAGHCRANPRHQPCDVSDRRCSLAFLPREQRRPMLWLVPGMILPDGLLEALTYAIVDGRPAVAVPPVGWATPT